MRISLNWLSSYVSLDGLSPQQVADALTMAGLEVESIETTGGTFVGVQLAHVTAVDPHPNADRLRLVTVDLGERQQQVVCGAPNVAVGQLIAFAPEGAQVFSPKSGEMFTLGQAKIRGVVSAGMVCSLPELGLSELYTQAEDGIWVLNTVLSPEAATRLGEDLRDVLGLVPDTVLEATPTVNRGDQMAMVEVAREVAALFQREFKPPVITPLPSVQAGGGGMRISLPDPSVCVAYAGLTVQRVTLGPSPQWLVQRLQAAGVRSINNVVDVTNYVMLELGQPLHAFDRDSLGHAGEVSVRRARPDETLATLDGVVRTLSEETVVITMNQKAVALAGVLGGADTQVTERTTGLFLESAYFPPTTTRRSARSVNVRTDASARFERGVDPEGYRRAMFRAAELLQQVADAQGLTWVEATTRTHTPELSITLRYPRLNQLLGMSLSRETVNDTLRRLGFTLKSAREAEAVQVNVPSWRALDVTREADLIEEVIRIHGFEKVPTTLPTETVPAIRSERQRRLARIHQTLRGAGLTEVVTPSLTGPVVQERSGMPVDEGRQVQVTRSHSEDFSRLRQSLLPTLLEVARLHLAQGTPGGLWVYEVGRIYHQDRVPTERDPGVTETFRLGGLMMGSPTHWQATPALDFFTLKGVVSTLLQSLCPQSAPFWSVPADLDAHWHPGQSAQVALSADGPVLGVVGRLHPAVAEGVKATEPLFAFDLDLDLLLAQAPASEGVLQKPSPYPAVKRDMAFLAPLSLSHQAIVETLSANAAAWLRQVQVFDDYRGKGVPEGQRSLAYRVTLQAEDQTLTDTQIEETLQQLRQRLAEAHGVVFR